MSNDSEARGRCGSGLRGRGRLRVVSALLAAALLLSASCAGCEQPTDRKLLLYCGGGIRPPVAELIDVFQRKHHAVIECSYAGSEVLLSKIKLSKSGDLYMPGDVYYVQLAEDQGLIAASETVCYFVPVILVQKGNPRNISSLADLLRPDVKVGLGDPEFCAIGRLVAKIFAKNGISQKEVDERVKYWAMTVNDLGEKVKLGALDAVIVWDAVGAYFAKDADVVPIPAEQNIHSTVAVGVLKSSQDPNLARQFVSLLTSAEGKAVFQKHRYTVAPPQDGREAVREAPRANFESRNAKSEIRNKSESPKSQ